MLLTTLSVRTSAKGRQYLSGFLGKSRVIACAGEPDKHGNETWDILVAEPDPRESTPAPRQCAPEREAGYGCTNAAPPASAHPGGSCRAPRPESARARQERVADEVAAEYGVHRDEELNDAVPF